MYTYDEALTKTLEYFGGNDLAANVFLTKYALRDLEGNLLEATPDDMHRRIAGELARIEKKKFKEPYERGVIYQLLRNFSSIIPQGSPMYGIGNPYRIVSLSNCFVIESPFDSYGGIFLTDQQIAQISKRRGGVGYDISTLRPDGESVSNSAATTSGATSFMHRFSHTGKEVGQKGRRGAQMISISVHHPDILKFATIKNDDKSVTGANISIRLTDEFLQAVKHDTDYELRWPEEPYSSKPPVITRKISARKVWNTIIHSAWLRAEPGLLFWDNILRESPADCYHLEGFRTISTNPCGEIPLSAYDSCRLLVVNLMSCVDHPFTAEATFNFDRLYNTAQIAQRLMDDIVDLEIECIEKTILKVEHDPEPDYIKKPELDLWQRVLTAAKEGRRTGTGQTALGDAIAAMGLKYGSDESIDLTSRIYQTLKLGAYRSSVDMAKELGPFKYYDSNKEVDCAYIQRIKHEDPQLYIDMIKYGRRNIACLTTAPTGSTSMLASLSDGSQRLFGPTSGIEPCYAISVLRRKRINVGDEKAKVTFIDKLGEGWMEFEVNHAGLDLWLSNNPGKTYKDSPYYGACANDINWTKRVELQAAAQKHVDHAISSTINLPKDVTETEVAKIYEDAWQHGLKGVTVYRAGCRDGIIVEKDNTVFPAERPRELPCDVHHITVQNQQYFVLVGLLNSRPYEVFAGKNGYLTKKVKTGTIIRKRKDFYKATFDDSDVELSPVTATTSEMEECITRLTSGLLRVGADMHFIVRQLEKVGVKQAEMYSFARSICRALKKYIPDGTKETGICDECGAETLIRQEGCTSCQSCGHSKCL